MSDRYYDHLVIRFADGTTERVGGNRTQVHDGVLTVWTASTLSGSHDMHRYVLANIREWHWEGEVEL